MSECTIEDLIKSRDSTIADTIGFLNLFTISLTMNNTRDELQLKDHELIVDKILELRDLLIRTVATIEDTKEGVTH